MIDNNYYEIVAVTSRGRITLIDDLTSEESDNVRRNYINKHGLFVHINGVKVPAQIHIYRQNHAHKAIEGDVEEATK